MNILVDVYDMAVIVDVLDSVCPEELRHYFNSNLDKMRLSNPALAWIWPNITYVFSQNDPGILDIDNLEVHDLIWRDL
jgi:hypothetical protein